ncbi:MAG TPA: hypothetical protein VGD35_00090 [Chitinophaga sp.]
MTVKLFLFTALFGLSVAAQAQTTTSLNTGNDLGRHNVYLNAMLAGQVVSVNYEFRLQPHQRGLGVYGGIGISPMHVQWRPEGQYDTHDIYGPDWMEEFGDLFKFESIKMAVPLGVNYLFGAPEKSTRFELGLGVTYVEADVLLFDDTIIPYTWILNATAGIRHYYSDNRFMWKVAFAPVMSLTRGTAPVPWFEGGVGLRF